MTQRVTCKQLSQLRRLSLVFSALFALLCFLGFVVSASNTVSFALLPLDYWLGCPYAVLLAVSARISWLSDVFIAALTCMRFRSCVHLPLLSCLCFLSYVCVAVLH